MTEIKSGMSGGTWPQSDRFSRLSIRLIPVAFSGETSGIGSRSIGKNLD
ncbi:hypothetical protein V0288_12465 [Pannus brasiliensis CCIBt3594]|uniref:Uncharacterized protein n=1 Tax=Pannus brasiliensis CCIBt3594 TaxID=1427578 RepID=A0AAW9QWM1_9CHRO